MSLKLLDRDDLHEFYPLYGDLSICTPLEDHQKKTVSEHLRIQQSNLKVIFSNNLSVQDVKRISKTMTIADEFREKIYKTSVGENIKLAMYEFKRDAKAPDFESVPEPDEVFSPSFFGNS